jgi:hypothetical protein
LFVREIASIGTLFDVTSATAARAKLTGVISLVSPVSWMHAVKRRPQNTKDAVERVVLQGSSSVLQKHIILDFGNKKRDQ